MNKPLILALAVALSGCATSKQTYGPDGSTTHSITCSGAALNWGMCYEKAGDLCGAAGYDVVTSTQDGGAVAGGSSAGFFAGPVMNRNMMVKCKAPK